MAYRFGAHLMIWSGQVGPAELALLPGVRAMGYHGVELPIFAPDAFDPQAVRAALAENGLACTASTALPAELSLLDPARHDATLAWFQGVIELTAAVGAPLLCGPLAAPVGALQGRGYDQAQWDAAVRGLQAAGALAADRGVTLAFEPINRFETFFLNTVDHAVRLMEAVDHPAVGLLLDTFHMHIEEKSTPAAIRRAGPYLRHVHASENDRGIVGSGQVPWRAVFAALAEVGYGGWVVVESFNAVIPELAGATCIWRPLAESPDALARESAVQLHSLAGSA